MVVSYEKFGLSFHHFFVDIFLVRSFIASTNSFRSTDIMLCAEMQIPIVLIHEFWLAVL